MRVLTTVAPRRDGTVRVMDAAGALHTFAPDAAGGLVCEIADAALIQRLVKTGSFRLLDAENDPRRKAPTLRGERHGALGGLSP